MDHDQIYLCLLYIKNIYIFNLNCISFMYDGMYEFSTCILQEKNCREKDYVAIM